MSEFYGSVKLYVCQGGKGITQCQATKCHRSVFLEELATRRCIVWVVVVDVIALVVYIIALDINMKSWLKVLLG